jgi:hypothetical protein
MADTRIVYSAHGTWWDSISKAATKPSGLPCCPVCGSVLFEMDSEEPWWDGACRYEADGHPGYVGMMEWGRGKCFPSLPALKSAYLAASGVMVP